MVDTENGSDFTVFAPVDDVFAKLPAETVGDQTPVQGATLTVAGGGSALTANDAKVIGSGAVMANAIVYLIDTVLTLRLPA